MLLILYILIVIINFMYIILKKKNNMLIYLSFFLIFFILLGNSKIPDYSIYDGNYIGNTSRDYIIQEYGYNFLVKLGRTLSLSYYNFKALTILFSLCIINIVLSKLKGNKHFFIFFYMISNIFLDSVQARMFIGLPFCLLSFYFLSREENKKAIFFIFLSLMIHYIYTFFFIFILFFYINQRNKRVLNFFIEMFFLLNLVIVFFAEKLNFLNKFSPGIYKKIQMYTREKTNLSIIVVIIFYYLTYIIYKKYLKTLKKEDRYENTIKVFIKISSIVIPLFFLNMNFYRILKIILFLTIILFSIQYKRIYRKYSFLLFFFFYSTYWVFFDMYSSKILERILLPLFFNRI